MPRKTGITAKEITGLLIELSANESEGGEFSDMHDESDAKIFPVVSSGSESDDHIEIDDSKNENEFVAGDD